MGFFDFFKKRKPTLKGEDICIDFSDKGININGKLIEIPSHIDALCDILGRPRNIKFKTSDSTREFLEQTAGVGMVTKRVNYTWDELGLYVYTYNGKVIQCFGLDFTKQSYGHSPKDVFKGKVTINGRPWFQEISEKGVDEEGFLAVVQLDTYNITAEYAGIFDDEDDDFSEGLPTDESGYAGIEFQTKSFGE